MGGPDASQDHDYTMRPNTQRSGVLVQTPLGGGSGHTHKTIEGDFGAQRDPRRAIVRRYTG